MKMFKVAECWGFEITEVEVARTTEATVWLVTPSGSSRRANRVSQYERYFYTITEAAFYARERLVSKVKGSRAQLERVEKQLAEFEQSHSDYLSI